MVQNNIIKNINNKVIRCSIKNFIKNLIKNIIKDPIKILIVKTDSRTLNHTTFIFPSPLALVPSLAV